MSVKTKSGKQYLRCTRRLNNKACPGCGKIYTEDVERHVYEEMVKKLREGQAPVGHRSLKEDPRVQKIYEEIEALEKEIGILVESLTGAGEILSSYIDQRVDQLDQLRRQKSEELVALSENQATPEQMERVVSNISLWDNIGFDEKRFTVDKMITVLKILPGTVQIQWKF